MGASANPGGLPATSAGTTEGTAPPRPGASSASQALAAAYYAAASIYLAGLGGRKNTGDWPSCATTEWGRELPNDGGQAAAAASPAPAARQEGVHQGRDAPGRVQAQLGGRA